MRCNEYGNETSGWHAGLDVGTGFGGIPGHLLWNSVAAVLIMIMFVCVRRSPFKSTSRDEQRKLVDKLGFRHQKMYEDEEDSIADLEEAKVRSVEKSDKKDTTEEDEMAAIREKELTRMKSLNCGGGIINWLKRTFSFITFSNETMFRLAGRDGVHYLRFQRYLMFISGVTMVIAILLLPINMTGGNYKHKGTQALARTTITNRKADDHVLILHTILSFLLFPASIYTMRQFSKGLRFLDISLKISHTLLIENIPKHMCKIEIIKEHFAEAYEDPILVTEVTLAYDVKDLSSRAEELRNAKSSKKYAEVYKVKHPGKSLTMKPKPCSRFSSCFCCDEKVDVSDFYSKEEVRLEEEVIKLTKASLDSPLGIAFVTFNDLQSSKAVYDDFSSTILNCYKRTPKQSEHSLTLLPERWRVSFAPPATDIHWENLNDGRGWLITKKIFAHILMVAICLFLTTPEYILSHLVHILSPIYGEKVEVPEIVEKYIPSLLLLVVTLTMPTVITWSVRWLGYWYKSEENLVVMRRIFWYLWLCIIIAPTFGFTTGLTLMEYYLDAAHGENNQTETETEKKGIRWQCVGLPDSGAMFINYVITSAMVGNFCDLLRIGDFFFYLYHLFLSKTPANAKAVQRAVTYEFRFGEHYGRMLMIFSLIIMFSFSTPMITPFGFLYFVTKYFVDKHNLAFVFKPSEIDTNMHKSAINLVIFAVGMLQFYLTTKSLIRSRSLGWYTPRNGISLALLAFSAAVFFAQAYSQFCKKLSPIRYEEPIYEDNVNDPVHGDYIPDVLKKSLKPEENEASMNTNSESQDN